MIAPAAAGCKRLVDRGPLHGGSGVGRVWKGGQVGEITPAVMVFLAPSTVQNRPEGFRVAKEPHRVDTKVLEASCHVAEEPPAYAHALVLTKHLDLVELSAELWMVAVALRERNQLAVRPLDAQTEKACVVLGERFATLPLPDPVARSLHE
jgi:hypothetical protein